MAIVWTVRLGRVTLSVGWMDSDGADQEVTLGLRVSWRKPS